MKVKVRKINYPKNFIFISDLLDEYKKFEKDEEFEKSYEEWLKELDEEN